MKLKWKAAEAPTGPYRAFQRRAWPMAYLKDGRPAFMLTCPDAYVPGLVREGKHGPLTIRVASYHKQAVGFTWLRFERTAESLAEAKERCQRYADKHPEVFVQGTDDAG